MKLRLTKDLGPMRENAIARLNDATAAHVYSLVASPIAIIRERKLAEAKRVLGGDGGGVFLTTEARGQGLDIADLAASVVAKAAAQTEKIAAFEARRQVAQAAIRAAAHPAAIEAALEAALEAGIG